MTEETGIAIISGRGALPRLLAEDAAARGRNYRVVTFAGVPVDWAAAHPNIEAQFEKLGALFSDMKAANCHEVVFAGGMARPKLNPLRFDATFAKLSVKLLPALKSGDDATLRVIVAAFEDAGFAVRPAHEILSELTVGEGILTQARPTDDDRADAKRAAEIARVLGAVDVGQGAVVAQGICLGAEAIQGTDAMLRSVADSPDFRPDPEGARGVLYKAPKPQQDWRVDLPAIGPDTIRNAAAAGLAGVVIQAGAVIVLDRAEVVRAADEAGLFLWSRPIA